jgi:hypothetical protein
MDAVPHWVQYHNTFPNESNFTWRFYMKYASRMLAIAVMMAPLLASAQLGSANKIVAQVPFEFRAGSKIVPAGQTVIQLASMSGTALSIRNLDEKVNMFAMSYPDTPPKGAGNTLVFHKYGDRYFLSEIRVEGSATSYRLPEGKVEAELRAQNVPVVEKTLLAQLR